MKTSIVIAWKDLDCPHRRRSFEFVTAFWRRHLPDAEIVVESGPEPFGRSRALNAAIRRATGDVLFEVGPDSIVTPRSVREALGLAASADGLVVCHSRWLHLSQAATERLVALGPERAEEFTVEPDRDADDWGTTSVDIACFSRATWAKAGGYDERFGMWGGDDGAFSIACDQLVSPTRRVEGDWLHLWHPRLPESVPGHPLYVEQFMLLSDYLEAAKLGAVAVRDLVWGT